MLSCRGQNRLYEFRLGKKDEINEKTDCKAVEKEGRVRVRD